MAETVKGKSRERFLILFGLIEQDQGLAPALQTQSSERAERDSWSCFGMVSRNREWCLLGRDKPEQEQGEVPNPVWIE